MSGRRALKFGLRRPRRGYPARQTNETIRLASWAFSAREYIGGGKRRRRLLLDGGSASNNAGLIHRSALTPTTFQGLRYQTPNRNFDKLFRWRVANDAHERRMHLPNSLAGLGELTMTNPPVQPGDCTTATQPRRSRGHVTRLSKHLGPVCAEFLVGASFPGACERPPFFPCHTEKHKSCPGIQTWAVFALFRYAVKNAPSPARGWAVRYSTTWEVVGQLPLSPAPQKTVRGLNPAPGFFALVIDPV